MSNRHVASAYWSLRVAFGIVPIVAGLDKFTNILTQWQSYLSPLAVHLLPVSPSTFMHLAGVIEVTVGVLILAGKARIFGFVACVWLAAIAVELLTTGHFFDVAARDAVMAVAAFALGRLAQVAEQHASARVPITGETAHAHA